MRFNSKHLVQIALIAAGVVFLITGDDVAAIWMFVLDVCLTHLLHIRVYMRPLYIFDIDGTLADNRHRNHLIEKHPKCERCAGTGEYFCHTDFGSHTCDLCGGSGKLKGWRPDWNKWYSLAEFDKPNVAIVRILDQLCMLGDQPNIHDVDKPEIWFFTGRPEEHRELTTTWLTINTAIYREELIHGQLVMRTTGDYRPDYIVK